MKRIRGSGKKVPVAFHKDLFNFFFFKRTRRKRERIKLIFFFFAISELKARDEQNLSEKCQAFLEFVYSFLLIDTSPDVKEALISPPNCNSADD